MTDTPNLCPYGDDNPVMAGAWAACLRWALTGDDEGPRNIRSAYEQETGNKFMPGRSPIERAVDRATGYAEQASEKYVREFIPWFNANVWGRVMRAK